MRFIDVDDSAKLDIRCKANRSFELSINLNKDLSGKSYKLQVSNGTNTLLSLDMENGITIDGQSINLIKSSTDMAIPTGCYKYDLVEITGDNAQNIFHGWFIIEPTITAL